MKMHFNTLFVAAALCLTTAAYSVEAAQWCGKEGCYDVLGVKETADNKEIRVSYYKLSRQWHPDKNKHPDAPKKFQRIAKAYEVLSDDRSRKRYDYALAHPEEEVLEEVIGIWKYWRTDVRAVLLGFLAVVSVVQYAAKLSSWKQAMEKIRAQPRYKNRRAQLVEEYVARQKANGSSSSSGKANRRPAAKAGKAAKGGPNLSEEADAEIQEQLDSEVGIHGGYNAPTYKDVIAWQLVALPYRVGKWVYWQAHWQWAYRLQGQQYSPEDAAYLTQKQLRWPPGVWQGLGPETQEEYISLELWQPDNFKAFMREVKQGKRKLPKMQSLEANPAYDPWANMGDD